MIDLIKNKELLAIAASRTDNESIKVNLDDLHNGLAYSRKVRASIKLLATLFSSNS